MANSYNALVSIIPVWTNNTTSDELNTEIPGIIRRVQQKMSRALDILAERKNVFSSLVVGDPFINLPSDNVEIRSVYVYDDGGSANPLTKKSIEYAIEYWPDRNETGSARYYADWDNTTLLVVPTPASANKVEVFYNYRLDALSSTNQTNWFTDHAEDALLYGCLSEAYKFLQDEERAVVYGELYDKEVTRIQNEAEHERIDDYEGLRKKQAAKA